MLVGRAMAWSFTDRHTDRATYATDQREAGLRAFAASAAPCAITVTY
ncbi:hypothetical protein [Lentzea sp. NPDC059081]